MSAIKWDGVTRDVDIARVLIKFISEEDRRMARTMAYGDVGRHLEKKHGAAFHCGNVGDDFVQTDSKGVTVTFNFRDSGDEAYKLTWNKAAKLICEHIYDNEYEYDEDDEDDEYDEDDDDDEEITDIAPIDDEPTTAETYKDAISCHAEILAGAELAQQGLYRMATGFKKMRDEKLYKALGYSSFEEYCEKETGLKRRQVYGYISIVEKLPSEFVQSTAQIGSEKLKLLAKLDEGERKEITDSVDLESATVRQLKEKIEELRYQKDKDDKDYDDLDNMYDELKDKYSKLSAAYDRASEQRKEDADRIAKLDSDLTEMTERMENYRRQAKSKAQEVQQVSDLDIEMYADKSALAADLRDEIARLEDEIRELEKRPIDVTPAVPDYAFEEEVKDRLYELMHACDDVCKKFMKYANDHEDIIKGSNLEWMIKSVIESGQDAYNWMFIGRKE